MLPDTLGVCHFCRIVEGSVPETIINRTEGFVAIEDIDPQADVHLLVLPERHIDTFRDIGQFPADEAKRMLDFIAETAAAAGLDGVPAGGLLWRGTDGVPPALAHPRRPHPSLAGLGLIGAGRWSDGRLWSPC